VSQFRTTADIKREVLQKAGEPRNGNSPFEEQAMTYINKVHQAIVGGGSIFNLNVDEAWNWARAKNPIVMELQPAFTRGDATVIRGDVNVTLTDIPPQSVVGWFFQLVGHKTVYKVTAHDNGTGSLILDAGMIESSGAYSFRLFKLDYDISPGFIYIGPRNDRLDFREYEDGPILTATLSHGSYTPSQLIAHVVARLTTTGDATYTGTYDEVLKLFTINSDLSGAPPPDPDPEAPEPPEALFDILGASGASRRRSALQALGLDLIDHTGSASYTSAYIINGISRLIEPFKVFARDGAQPFIESTDPIDLETQHPITHTDERMPTHFAHIAEDNEGSITVRFNAYPRDRVKISIDWIPIPYDLQDNDASYPLVPRKDIDVLIHGAAAFILFDKEDTKWQDMFQLAQGALEAMQRKNRSQLFRTGPSFGQIIARPDLAKTPRKLRYGYTVESGASSVSYAETTQAMIKLTRSFADFASSNLSHTITLRSLPANRTLFAIIVKHTIPFSGLGISTVTLSIGVAGDPTKFITSFDLTQSVADGAQDSVLLLFYPASATDLTATLTVDTDNTSALTAGSVDIYIQESVTE